MTRSPLLCCTSIIQSSPLVQASSSLSMICARAWPTGATRQRNPFPPFFARVLFELLIHVYIHTHIYPDIQIYTQIYIYMCTYNLEYTQICIYVYKPISMLRRFRTRVASRRWCPRSHVSSSTFMPSAFWVEEVSVCGLFITHSKA